VARAPRVVHIIMRLRVYRRIAVHLVAERIRVFGNDVPGVNEAGQLGRQKLVGAGQRKCGKKHVRNPTRRVRC
jgi:hypothetical protein